MKTTNSSSIYADTSQHLQSMLGDFKKNNTPQEVDFKKLVEIKNPDRITHYIHPYPAKLLQHIPIYFLANDILSNKGDIVFDPFCGSGTVMLESAITDREGYGIDVNPLAVLIASTKCTKLIVGKVSAELKQLKKYFEQANTLDHDVVNSNYWYASNVRDDLSRLSNSLEIVEDSSIRNLFKVCLSIAARKMSFADPRISVPVKINPNKYHATHRLRVLAEKHLNDIADNKVIDVFENIVSQNIRRINELNAIDIAIAPSIKRGDARQLLPNEKGGDIQLIITSPPYPGAQKYIRSSSLSLGWLKLCSTSQLAGLKRQSVGREEICKSKFIGDLPIESAACQLHIIKDINMRRAAIAEIYLKEMINVINGCAAMLKDGGWLVLVAANNFFCGTEFMTQEFLANIATNAGLTLRLQLVDHIKSYGLMTKRNKTAGLITREWVHVFQKG